MKQINDILNDLDINVDLEYKKNDINVDKNNNIFINDIDNKKNSNINISYKKEEKLVLKNKTKVFDSIIKNIKLKDINLQDKDKYKDKDKNKKKKEEKKKKNFNNKSKKNNEIKLKLLNNNFNFGKRFYKYLMFIIFVIILIYLLFGFLLQKNLNNGYIRLINLSNSNLEKIDINSELDIINNNFKNANFYIKPFLIIPNNKIKNIYYLIKGGNSLVGFLSDSYNYYKTINLQLKNNLLNNFNFLDLLNNGEYIYKNFSANLESSIYYFEKVENIFNNDINNKLIKNKYILKEFYYILSIINRNYTTLKNIFGDSQERKYLILFQNNDEIRPTGGFIGSVGTITIKNGKIIEFKNDDIYAYEWEINKNYINKILAPEGINKLTKYLGLRDANYKIGFNDSSKEIKKFLNYFYTDINGVIYINQLPIIDLLNLIGGVYFEKIDLQIDSNNFSSIISSLVESKLFKVGTLGTPKKILFDFSNDFIKKLKEKGLYSKYAEILFENIKSREIVFNSFIPEENSLAWKLGIDGNISYSSTIDFNYPVFMSVGGSKTDRYIIRNFSKNVTINDDCSIDTNFQILQKHFFTNQDELKLEQILNKFDIDKKSIIYGQGKAENKQFIQLVLPKNAIIKDSNNYQIVENENNKIISFYTNLERFQILENNIDYKIENKECIDYNYIFYKQSGLKDYDINLIINGEEIEKKGLNKDFYYNY